MGKASRRKAMKHPKRIRTRSDAEIQSIVIAYQRLFETDPYWANMMLLVSELSEFLPIPPFDKIIELKKWMEKNKDGLEFQFLRRFKAIDERAIPFLDLPIEIKGTKWIN